MDLEEHKRSFKLTLLGLFAVISSAVAAISFTSNTGTGRIVRFLIPLLVGMIFGGKIYLIELKKVNNKIKD